jgi:hypothetical protein
MLLRRNILLRLKQPIYCCYSSSYLKTLVAMYEREDSPVEVVPERIEGVILGMIFAVACDLSRVCISVNASVTLVSGGTHIVSDLNRCLLSNVAVPVQVIRPQMSTEWHDDSLSALAHLLVSEPKSTGSTSPGRADMTEMTDTFQVESRRSCASIPFKASLIDSS